LKLVHFDRDGRDEWNSFIREHDHHVFHYYEWAKIFSEAYGFEPLYCGVRNGAGRLVAVLPLFLTDSIVFGRSLKSMPYHIEGGAVVSASVPEIREVHSLLHKHILGLQTEHRARNVDVKTRDQRFLDAIPANQCRIYHVYYRYVCDISVGEEALFKRFRSDLRGSIRRSARFGVDAEVGDRNDDIERFYDLYLLWAKAIGLPGHSRRFFRLLWETFYPRGMARIVFAKYGKELIAAKLFLIDPSNASVLQNWGAISDFGLKRVQVNSALHWAEIRWAIANGYRSFDFGVTSEHHTGSNYFKTGWNTEKIKVAFANLGDFSATKRRDDHNAGRLFRVFWKRVPTSISERVGPWILTQGN